MLEIIYNRKQRKMLRDLGFEDATEDNPFWVTSANRRASKGLVLQEYDDYIQVYPDNSIDFQVSTGMLESLFLRLLKDKIFVIKES